ncbi:hypothetical protein ASPZODRAFT_139261 [Penicilliopsis zonata CBS 506.65]|uniref:Uncharacterized protein n=1 Tax=Penicilliopsis zonata CBS 506.65 TaxID=1073090 RepID=A0A1L9SS16_9EURO|nr:hypothetical protein ASPZODRAFT_139261 [Penicilliopsis zonata CBS 506.65]OJJ49916.1 hypothetical protein ASPZODRAFT_139261 [Penicilliopsis zonata CBS 506.65]
MPLPPPREFPVITLSFCFCFRVAPHWRSSSIPHLATALREGPAPPLIYLPSFKKHVPSTLGLLPSDPVLTASTFCSRPACSTASMRLRQEIRPPQRLEDELASSSPISNRSYRFHHALRPRHQPLPISYVDFNPNLPPAVFPTLELPQALTPVNQENGDAQDRTPVMTSQGIQRGDQELDDILESDWMGFDSEVPNDVDPSLASSPEDCDSSVDWSDSDSEWDTTAECNPIDDPRWSDLSVRLQVEIFENLLQVYTEKAVFKKLGLNGDAMREIHEHRSLRNKQIRHENKMLGKMRTKQLNALLQLDNSERKLHRVPPQLVFRKISRQQTRKIKDLTEFDWQLCQAGELYTARRYLELREIDPKHVGTWTNNVVNMQTPRENNKFDALFEWKEFVLDESLDPIFEETPRAQEPTVFDYEIDSQRTISESPNTQNGDSASCSPNVSNPNPQENSRPILDTLGGRGYTENYVAGRPLSIMGIPRKSTLRADPNYEAGLGLDFKIQGDNLYSPTTGLLRLQIGPQGEAFLNTVDGGEQPSSGLAPDGSTDTIHDHGLEPVLDDSPGTISAGFRWISLSPSPLDKMRLNRSPSPLTVDTHLLTIHPEPVIRSSSLLGWPNQSLARTSRQSARSRQSRVRTSQSTTKPSQSTGQSGRLEHAIGQVIDKPIIRKLPPLGIFHPPRRLDIKSLADLAAKSRLNPDRRARDSSDTSLSFREATSSMRYRQKIEEARIQSERERMEKREREEGVAPTVLPRLVDNEDWKPGRPLTRISWTPSPQRGSQSSLKTSELFSGKRKERPGFFVPPGSNLTWGSPLEPVILRPQVSGVQVPNAPVLAAQLPHTLAPSATVPSADDLPVNEMNIREPVAEWNEIPTLFDEDPFSQFQFHGDEVMFEDEAAVEKEILEQDDREWMSWINRPASWSPDETSGDHSQQW